SAFGDTPELTQVGIAALDLAQRITPHVTVGAKLGLVTSGRSWTTEDGDELSFSTRTYLLQGSVQVPVSERIHLEVFGRQLSDSLGGQRRGAAVELSLGVTEDVAFVIGYGSLGVDDPDLQDVAPWSD